MTEIDVEFGVLGFTELDSGERVDVTPSPPSPVGMCGTK